MLENRQNKSKLSDKYIAGFLDADGSISLYWRKVDRADTNPETRRGYIALRFTQQTKKDEVLYKIQENIGGKISFYENKEATELLIFGNKAQNILNRIKKHLVIKRHYANVVLDMAKKVYNSKQARIYLKEQRKIRSLPLPNYPPRQWLAGYFDGDGCLCARLPRKRNSVQPTFEITSSDYDSEGIEIINKAFGGSINIFGKNKNLIKLTITMPPSKAKKILGYFAKHLITKKEQAYFILGCASMEHYHDGNNIKEAMKQLKVHPHRLNEPKPDVSLLLSKIKDIKFKATYKRRQYKKVG